MSKFTSLLTLIFITLKLIDKISWSWIWVLSPTWIFIVSYIAFAIILSCIPIHWKFALGLVRLK